MKIKITMKTPDCVSDAIDEAIGNELENMEFDNEYEREDESVSLENKIKKSIAKFVEYGECVTIEIDTVTNTAIVIPVGE